MRIPSRFTTKHFIFLLTSFFIPLTFFFTVFTQAAIIVVFPDPNLEAKIRAAIGKPTGDIYDTDLVGTGFISLNASSSSISNLTGLEFCTDLQVLYLGANNISNISQLSSLTNLTMLTLNDNSIINVNLVSPLINLEYLEICRRLRSIP